jgi:hypothetical protein
MLRDLHVTVINAPRRDRTGWAEVRTRRGARIVPYCLNDKPEDLLEKVLQSRKQSFIEKLKDIVKKII